MTIQISKLQVGTLMKVLGDMGLRRYFPLLVAFLVEAACCSS